MSIQSSASSATVQASTLQTLPLWKKIMYALGQFGWSLASYAVTMSLVYFYLPPKADIGPFVVQGNVIPLIKVDETVVFGLTIIGLVFALGRLFDGITDPLIAGFSDRSKLALGKRRSFLAISALPFALFGVLVFFPPVAGISWINSLWLFVTVFLFYWFMTMYVTPFFALLSEIGHTPNERLQLSTLISITWALGTMVGSQIENFQGLLVQNLNFSPRLAFQIVVVIFAIIGFIFMLLPILFIDEKRFAQSKASEGTIFQSLKQAFANKNFRLFTFSDLAYWVAITVINSVMVYYVVVLLKLDAGYKGMLAMVMFLLSFVFYIPVNFIAQKAGKKTMLLLAFGAFALVFAYAAGLGLYTLEPSVQGLILAACAAVPLSIFSIVQNAMVSDIAEADGKNTGNFKAGIFFGARTFMSKMGQTIAGFIIPSLLILGSSKDQLQEGTGELSFDSASEFGVRITALVAAAACVVGLILLIFYNEKQILRILPSEKKSVLPKKQERKF